MPFSTLHSYQLPKVLMTANLIDAFDTRAIADRLPNLTSEKLKTMLLITVGPFQFSPRRLISKFRSRKSCDDTGTGRQPNIDGFGSRQASAYRLTTWFGE